MCACFLCVSRMETFPTKYNSHAIYEIIHCAAFFARFLRTYRQSNEKQKKNVVRLFRTICEIKSTANYENDNIMYVCVTKIKFRNI